MRDRGVRTKLFSLSEQEKMEIDTSFYFTQFSCGVKNFGLHCRHSYPLGVVFFLSLFIYLERENAHKQGGGAERERERERIPSRLCIVSTEPDVGLHPMNCEITT